MPSPEELELAYGGWYRPAGGRFGGGGDAILRRLRERLARRLDRIAPPGRVLDVGAGDGALLDGLNDRGREAVGIDRAASHSAVRVLDLAEIGDGWAAIVFWHSLEHLPEAGAALDRAASMLDPDGVLVIAMPNAGSIQARLFGERWFAIDFPRHLVHVPSTALLDRLRQLGLAIERVSYLRGGQVVFGWLHGLVGALPGHPDLYDAIRRPSARREPLSGARRALALLAGTALLPVALACAAAEAALRRGGTVYVEARNV
jgi:SAM-dependent methyltransferase